MQVVVMRHPVLVMQKDTHTVIAVQVVHMHQVHLVHMEPQEQCLRPVTVVRQAVHVIPVHRIHVRE